MDSPLTPEYGPERKVNPVSRRLADTARARERLNFEASITLDAGLRELVAWWRESRREVAYA
jgi:UDP-glucose 4-epimerase